MRNPLRILLAAAYLLLAACVNPAYATPPIITNIFMVPRLTIQSDIGITNQIQFSTNLSQSNWFVITNLVVSHSPYTFVDSTISNGIQRFYRVLAFYPPPTPATLNVTGFTSPKVAGVAGTFTVSAKDSNNAVVTGYTGTVHFSSSDSAAVLPANYTFTSGDAGVHTFSATLKTAGNQSLTVSDTANASINGTQSGILVTPGTPAVLLVSGFPSPQPAGVSGIFSVQARDAFGNIVTFYAGTVHFSSSDSAAVLPANYTFTSGDAGVHTFSATLKTAGNQSLTVSDTANASINGTQSGILVTPGTPAVLLVSGFPNPQPAGVSGIITVQARDAFGNLTVGYSGTVHFSSSDPQAILPVNSTLQSGSKTFSATLKSAGLQSITGTDTVNTSINGSQSGITVLSGLASAVAVSSGNNQVGVAGTQLVQQLAVKITDSGGNAVAGTTVNWAATAGGTGVSVGSSSSITDASGIATTSATLGSSGGVNTFTATVTGLTGSPVTFNATAAKTLAVNSGNNQTGIAGTQLGSSLSVKVTDGAANPVAGITVNWAATAGGTGVSVGSSSSITDASGIATTSATLGSSGGVNTFTATVTGLTGSPVTFNATAAKNIVLNSGNNQTASAGHSLSVPLVIKVTDNANNPVSGIQVNWSVILGGTGATVSSSSTFTDASGLAQVTATLGNVAGANSFRATVTGLTGSPVTFNATGL